MIIQIILIGAIVAILLFLVKNRNTSRVRAWKKIAFILFAFLSIYSVAFPDHLTQLAHFLGIGRGADLLLYLLIVSFVYVCVNVYLKFKDLEHRNAVLAKEMAVLKKIISEQR